MLIRPDIAAVMTSASRDPEGYARKEAEKKQALSSASAAEIAREKAKEQDRLKRERVQKLKEANKIEEEKKMKSDPDYKKAVDKMNKTAKYKECAKLEVSRDIANQKTALQQRLALRKMRLQNNKHNSSASATSFDMLANKCGTPSSLARHNTITTKPIRQGMLELNAYLPNTPNGATNNPSFGALK